jgi:Aminotransferase class I and II
VLRPASTLFFDASVLCFEVNLNDLLRKSSIASSGGTTLNNMERQQQPMIIAASLVAAVSVVWFINSKSKKMSKTKKCPKDSTIGSRGILALSTPVPYINKFFLCLQDPCDPDTNRKGHVALCVAENKLITDLLAQRLMHSGTSSEAFSDSRVYCYSSFIGLPVAREAVAYFLARRFLYPGDPSLTPAAALEAISPLNVALGSGAAALLNYLFFILGEDGEVCLIPAPYYSAFDNDMSVIAGCRPFAVAQTNPTLGPSEQDLQLAYDKARSVRFSRPLCKELNNMDINHSLFVHSKVNPNNPCAVIYRADVIRNSIAWARKHKLQVIVDEIYALSTHKKQDHGFESVISVLENKLGDDVYMLWALSKDFGSSGFRVGTIYSQNEKFMEALSNLSIFSGVSRKWEANDNVIDS